MLTASTSSLRDGKLKKWGDDGDDLENVLCFDLVWLCTHFFSCAIECFECYAGLDGGSWPVQTPCKFQRASNGIRYS